MSKLAHHDLDCGPYTAEQLQPKEPYELSNGYLIQCMSTGGRGSKTTTYGAHVLETDPKVQSAGIDTGYAINHNTVRDPDVAVGNIPDSPGWVEGVPLLAVEYADTGQNEKQLATKIQQFLTNGTKYIWVVRLVGPRRVEVYEPNLPMRKVLPGEMLTAPDALQNPVPVNALYDREAAHEATLRNLLQRQGYASLEAVKAESEAKGKAEGEAKGKAEGEAKGKAEGEAKGKAEGEALLLKHQIIRRFKKLPKWAEQRIDKASSVQLETWAEGIFDAKSVKDLLKDQ